MVVTVGAVDTAMATVFGKTSMVGSGATTSGTTGMMVIAEIEGTCNHNIISAEGTGVPVLLRTLMEIDWCTEDGAELVTVFYADMHPALPMMGAADDVVAYRPTERKDPIMTEWGLLSPFSSTGTSLTPAPSPPLFLWFVFLFPLDAMLWLTCEVALKIAPW